jgi:hypothetical protein
MTHNHTDQCAGCNGKSDDEIAASYANLIIKFGWAAVGIFSEDEPPWMYTVGLQDTHDHPELVIYGLPLNLMHELLASAVQEIEQGKRFEPGTLADGVIAGYKVAVVKVDEPLDPRYPLNVATFFKEDDLIEAVQFVWPQEGGEFPWQEGGLKEQAVLGTWAA